MKSWAWAGVLLATMATAAWFAYGEYEKRQACETQYAAVSLGFGILTVEERKYRNAGDLQGSCDTMWVFHQGAQVLPRIRSQCPNVKGSIKPEHFGNYLARGKRALARCEANGWKLDRSNPNVAEFLAGWNRGLSE